MICKRCATGADLITQLLDMPVEERSGVNDFRARDFISVAKTLHSQCKGKTHCACQHLLSVPTVPKAQIQAVNYSGVSISKEQLSEISFPSLSDEAKVEPLY